MKIQGREPLIAVVLLQKMIVPKLTADVDETQRKISMEHSTSSTENRPLPQWGMLALFLGLISLGLAAIPSAALNRPITLNIGPADQKLKIDAAPVNDPTRWFTVAAICVALTGMGVTMVGYYRERIASIAACSLAVVAST